VQFALLPPSSESELELGWGWGDALGLGTVWALLLFLGAGLFATPAFCLPSPALDWREDEDEAEEPAVEGRS
jgi:hypothetical protein